MKEFEREAFIPSCERMGLPSSPEDVDADELPEPPDRAVAERGPESENQRHCVYDIFRAVDDEQVEVDVIPRFVTARRDGSGHGDAVDERAGAEEVVCESFGDRPRGAVESAVGFDSSLGLDEQLTVSAFEDEPVLHDDLGAISDRVQQGGNLDRAAEQVFGERLHGWSVAPLVHEIEGASRAESQRLVRIDRRRFQKPRLTPQANGLLLR